MNQRRLLSFACVVLAASSLVLGSTGFSSVNAERNVEIAVVEQADSYVGVVACAKSTETDSNSNPVHVWVTNRYTNELTVERIVGDDSNQYVPPSSQSTISPGQERRFEANFASETATVHVTAAGLDAEITAPVQSKQSCPMTMESNSGNSSNNKTATSETSASSSQDT